jgi:hypothetical protein
MNGHFYDRYYMQCFPLELMDSLYDVSPLLPIAVHVTHDNKVIVGALICLPLQTLILEEGCC